MEQAAILLVLSLALTVREVTPAPWTEEELKLVETSIASCLVKPNANGVGTTDYRDDNIRRFFCNDHKKETRNLDKFMECLKADVPKNSKSSNLAATIGPGVDNWLDGMTPIIRACGSEKRTKANLDEEATKLSDVPNLLEPENFDPGRQLKVLHLNRIYDKCLRETSSRTVKDRTQQSADEFFCNAQLDQRKFKEKIWQKFSTCVARNKLWKTLLDFYVTDPMVEAFNQFFEDTVCAPANSNGKVRQMLGAKKMGECAYPYISLLRGHITMLQIRNEQENICDLDELGRPRLYVRVLVKPGREVPEEPEQDIATIMAAAEAQEKEEEEAEKAAQGDTITTATATATTGAKSEEKTKVQPKAEN